ncbi:MAG TPA: hypothetical protein VM938_10790 [Acidimicrobiales bacterium]|nr:hypothetical protein [Acidimicrobiales bacterium]
MTGIDGVSMEALSIGAVSGVVSNKAWTTAIDNAMRRVAEVRDSYSSPFNVNVVFHVPAGRDFTPEFEGIRSGRFSRKERTLMVQVAIPEGAPEGEPDQEVRRLLLGAIDLAEDFARMEALISEGDRLDGLRAIVAAI